MGRVGKSLRAVCQHGPTNTYLVASPIGDLEVVCCPKGVHALSQSSVHSNEDFNPDLNVTVHISSQLYQDNGYTYKPILDCVDWLGKYFTRSPEIKQLPVPTICHLQQLKDGCNFTDRVWDTLLRKVALGETVSYGQLAQLCGNSLASRSVGQAMRNNPVMLLVPCHRVILSSGRVGNYAGGKRNVVKQWLLYHEANFGSSFHE